MPRLTPRRRDPSSARETGDRPVRPETLATGFSHIGPNLFGPCSRHDASALSTRCSSRSTNGGQVATVPFNGLPAAPGHLQSCLGALANLLALPLRHLQATERAAKRTLSYQAANIAVSGDRLAAEGATRHCGCRCAIGSPNEKSFSHGKESGGTSYKTSRPEPGERLCPFIMRRLMPPKPPWSMVRAQRSKPST